MAFALAVNHLIAALKEPGCPICSLYREAAERSVESFLWENVNDPQVRQGIIDSYGFCKPHTRLLVAREIFTSSIPLGTNIIYEHLGRLVAGELASVRPTGSGEPGGLGDKVRTWLYEAGLGRAGGKLQPRGICPICAAGENFAVNHLHTLCEELEKEGDVLTAYKASDGLCLDHLRASLDLHSEHFPNAVRFLVDDTVDRLTQQSAHMKEFIRKANWSYQNEKVSEEEDLAWRKTLTFFTGYPGTAFTHKFDPF